MQPGRKVVMLATNAFGLGIDKPDIRYIIHYQMPGSPESYVQEAGRAGRDGKPARCVLLFQPDDISIQEHFLKEAHPTKSQARMVAEGLYAWSDEGKEVSVRDLALSMALPERRVRVILSVLEAMGVAEEVKAARWKGVEPKPTREQIDKAAMVFEARRISDRRRLAALLSYMNTQKCRVQMLRAYFGEPEGAQCGLCDSDARAWTARCSIRRPPTSGTGCTRRPTSTRGRVAAAGDAAPARKRRCMRRQLHRRRPGSKQKFRATCCRRWPPFEVPPPPDSELTFDEGLWAAADAGAGDAMPGDAVVDMAEHDTGAAPAQVDSGAPDTGAAPPATEQDFNTGWAAIRDANIRPYAEWRAGAPVTLPVLVARPVSAVAIRATTPATTAAAQGRRRRRSPPSPGRRRRARRQIRRRRRAAGAAAASGSGGAGATATAATVDNNRRDHHRHRDRERGPRLPGCLQPGRRLMSPPLPAATSVAALPGGTSAAPCRQNLIPCPF